MLMLDKASVHRAGRAVLRHASLRAPAPGIAFLVGPGGAGKSSLLLALSGDAGADGGVPAVLGGTVELAGVRLAAGSLSPVLVPQHAALGETTSVRAALAGYGIAANAVPAWLAGHGLDARAIPLDAPAAALARGERRALAVLAALHVRASLYRVDEPTADIGEPSLVAAVRAALARLAKRSMVLVATHNRGDCLELGGHVALLAGGTIVESAEAHSFFSAPRSAAARDYVATGGCGLSPPRPTTPSDGIWWLVPGLLCGMSRPGLVAPAARQLHALHAGGVRHLVCLEERCTPDPEHVRAAGLALHHFAVNDMAAPSFAQAVDLCRRVEAPLRANEGVALHCRGGLGRTGTALALLLVWFGDRAEAAIAKVRAARPLAIQTVAQSRFVHDFATRVLAWR